MVHQRQAGPSGIREVQDRLAGSSGRGHRKGKQFLTLRENNFSHVEQLYNYGSAVRKIMYTTNAIESVNSSFRKVTKKGAFPNEDAVFKIFYLRIQELYKNGRVVTSQTGRGPEPAAHGRQDVSAYAAIRCCLLNRFTQNS